MGGSGFRCGLCDNGAGSGNARSVVPGRFYTVCDIGRSDPFILATGAADIWAIARYKVKSRAGQGCCLGLMA